MASERGWLLLGYGLRIFAAVDQGPLAVADRCSMLFDVDYLQREVKRIRQQDSRIIPIGTLHTHPRGKERPSRQDFVGHSEWVKLLPQRFGIFGIATDDALTWWLLRVGDEDYMRINYASARYVSATV